MRSWLSFQLFACIAAGASLPDISIAAQPPDRQPQVVEYQPEFFQRYQPVTALDMVRQLPGFQLDDGSGDRGFGNVVGNVLINDRRPSAKEDTPSQILARIPASTVERIDLIRGQVRGIDMQGQAVVASIILQDDSPAASRWELAVRKTLDLSPLTPSASISRSDYWRDIEFNAGLELRRPAFGDQGTVDVLDGTGSVAEIRDDLRRGLREQATANLIAATNNGGTLLRFNTKVFINNLDEKNISHREQQPGGELSSEFFDDVADVLEFEIGADLQRDLTPGFVGKAILLHSRDDADAVSAQQSVDAQVNQTRLRVADSEQVESESIARIELDWARTANRAVQINFEGAFNDLDNTLELTEDTGQGPIPVAVPSANARVEEVRWDLLVLETWTSDGLVLDYGLGAERSTIKQSGDTQQERTFTFLKPRVVLTYAQDSANLSRLRVEREVSQLDFDDFVSATVFQDDDLALGNPDLEPESTWIAEASYERRYGDIGVAKLTLFHHWISDVEDLLPLTDEFEAPGNIGDGRRWGIIIETTVPLDAVGLADARLEFAARWQDSTVTDPVTFEDRVLSAESETRRPLDFFGDNEYAFELEFRQDFDQARIAWGFDVRTRAEHPLFKVNELDVHDEGVEFNVFAETTRWFGMKIRIDAQNLTDLSQTRDRSVFTGLRDLSAIDFRELHDSTDGRRVILTLSGTF